MRILGIDTAASTASAALVADRRVIGEEIHPPRTGVEASGLARPKTNHAETILPLIEALLRKASLRLSDLSGIAVSIGPGSFTGLRIALSTVKGLAMGTSVPVVGVSTLCANAARVGAFDGLICSCLDARKEEVYAALFRQDATRLQRLSQDAVVSVAKLIEAVQALDPAKRVLFIGEGAVVYRQLIEVALSHRAEIQSGEAYRSIAAAVGLLGKERFERGDTDPLGSLVPVYLRRPEAEMKLAESV